LRPERELDPASWISTDTTDSALGHIERHCEHCHREWIMGQPQCPQCGGHIFVEKIVNPTPVEAVREADSPAGSRWRFWEKPKAAEPAYNPAAVETLGELRASLDDLARKVSQGDSAARELVNTPHADGKYSFAQAKLAEAAIVAGDVSTSDPLPLLRCITALKMVLDEALTEEK
jgi:hypothetical protein